MAVIILGIPTTSRVSMYMQAVQKELSKVRDQRIKLSNEVLSGMKVIKLQAWEKEFQNRILEVRETELALMRRYAFIQSYAGILALSIPLLVAILTFMTYVALGNTLTVATALTSLALFEVLRFPLFMLPQVINNLIEARVSVDRIQSFLIQGEVKPVPSYPLKKAGVLLDSATLVWENAIYKYKINQLDKNPQHAKPTVFTQLAQPVKEVLNKCFKKISFGKVTPFPAPAKVDEKNKHENIKLSEEEMDLIIKDALIADSETIIKELEKELKLYRKYNTVDYPEDGEDSEPTSPFMSKEESFDNDSDYLRSQNNRNINSFLSNSLLNNNAKRSESSTTVLTNNTANSNTTGQTHEGEKRLLTLSRVNLHASTGQMISIVGQVGSGKSSLLRSLLGDLKVCLGKVAMFGEVAYAAQLPFIQNSTLRDNILYGKPYDERKYQNTLKMCALLPDLDVLPAGDSTEIGERGINLSGGQKSRVGLARAVYSDANIYLLDDPLSAVDAHVGKHLFEECVMKLKEMNKCIIFVTNALHFVKHSTKIFVLKDGHIAESGNYFQLMKRGTLFKEMMTTLQDTGNSSSLLANHEEEGADDSLKVTLPNNKTTEDVNLLDYETHGKKKDDELIKEVPKEATSKDTKQSENKVIKELDSSVRVGAKDDKASAAAAGKLITTEEQEVGDVDFKVYLKWSNAAGGVIVGVLIIAMFYIVEIISMCASWWLSFWSQHQNSSNGSSPWFYLGIYALINLGIILVGLVREIYVRLRALDASRELFHELLSAVLYAPMSFFDTTPLGRIINRFSKDVYTVDAQLPYTVRGYVGTIARVTCILFYIVLITPLFLLGLVPLLIFYYMAQKFYLKTSRELTRIENTARSPIYALFSETLDGITTIRAYHAEKRLIQRNNKFLDNNQKSYFLNFSANCWLAVRLEFAGTLIVTFSALFAVLAREAYISKASFPNDTDVSQHQKTLIFAGLAGLSISFAMNITQSLNWTVRMASDLESQMVSVERIKSYASMKQEAGHYLINDPKTIHNSSQNSNLDDLSRSYSRYLSPSNDSSSTANPLGNRSERHGNYWPSQGKIVVNNVCLRYRENLPLVLNQCSFTVQPREKIGIVGRTGAGKSSLVTALLRLVELESGEVLIDDINTRSIGLNTLRSVMAVIPQDPVLFSGTIRSNLDPFRRYTDGELWDILRRTLLSDHIQSLDDVVQENGGNYSVGQRQLLCIARALLSKATIIIMDEVSCFILKFLFLR
jgi:ATP-binding cassette subfamily C (CFTR/MRP) protein 1